MLILTRRVGESVKIGDEVTVTVLGVKGPNVRLGFAAPREVAVHREEIYERLHGGSIDIPRVARAVVEWYLLEVPEEGCRVVAVARPAARNPEDLSQRNLTARCALARYMTAVHHP